MDITSALYIVYISMKCTTAAMHVMECRWLIYVRVSTVTALWTVGHRLRSTPSTSTPSKSRPRLGHVRRMFTAAHLTDAYIWNFLEPSVSWAVKTEAFFVSDPPHHMQVANVTKGAEWARTPSWLTKRPHIDVSLTTAVILSWRDLHSVVDC